jgi:hypothetical protein
MPTRTILVLLFAAAIFGVAACNTSTTDLMETPRVQAAKDDKLKTNETRTPVIVELFTSEGCSSCPPADKVLAALESSQQTEGAEVIALSEHVDYWNRLGWTDPFSKPQFSNRQGEYSQFFGKGGNVYTPQMVVDGVREFPGHNAGEALKSIAAAAKETKGDVSIAVKKLENNTVSLDVKIENLPKISANDSAIVLLAVTENNLSTDVPRGENAGQKLPHIGVVRYLQNIGEIAGDKTLSPTVALPREWKRENLNLVAFVQETGSRRVLAAQRIHLK